VDGVFVEVHDAPEKALSDGANALRLDLLADFWKRLQQIHALVSAPEFARGPGNPGNIPS
jgi:2-dehydro-3-deoxyphosphooctonate aldolase (KDO 8-P synthase)